MDVLALTEGARPLARLFVECGLTPMNAVEGAFPGAVATPQGMDFLMTWNFKRIAILEAIERRGAVCTNLGYRHAS